MKEHSIFISYRKDDGEDLAVWIHKKLNGRTLVINNAKGPEGVMLTTQLDISSASGANWKKDYLDSELQRANSICIICTPAAMINKSDGEDYLDYEISWWIENRKNSPPLLASPKKYAVNYIPNKISSCWANPQVSVFDEFNDELFLESITRGITHSAKLLDNHSILNIDNSTQLKGLYFWEKDRFGKYLTASELYARAAGYDSPHAMIGKTDDNMPWRSLAKFFQEGDRKIITGNALSRMCVWEKEIMVDKVADILVHENVLQDHSERIIGVTGCFIDVSGMEMIENSVKYKMDEAGLKLGEDFGNQRLDLDEVRVFRGLVRNKSKKTISNELNIELSLVESIIVSLQRKLQCANDREIVVIAVRSGLPLKLFNSFESDKSQI